MRQKQSIFSLFLLSPSSWRAWIEMGKHGASKRASSVALLPEGVDRNSIAVARRITLRVALLTEGVDRNLMKKKNWKPVTWSPSSRRVWIEMDLNIGIVQGFLGRPPRGGRG